MFLRRPTSFVILCWGILAHSSRRNCFRWPRLWFDASHARTALPNWSRRCSMGLKLLSPGNRLATFTLFCWKLYVTIRAVCGLALSCWYTALGPIWCRKGIAVIPEILLSVGGVVFLGRPHLARSLTFPVSLYQVINLVIVDVFTPKVKATSWHEVPDWTCH